MLVICANEYKGHSLAGFVRYVTARLFEEYEKRAFRVYVTDTLFAITNNTARFAGGSVMEKRFWDFLYAEPTLSADTQVDAQSIIMGVINRAGLGVEIN